MTYNRFISGLKAAGVEVDRKILADLAVTDPAAFAALVEVAKANAPAADRRCLTGARGLTARSEPIAPAPACQATSAVGSSAAAAQGTRARPGVPRRGPSGRRARR